MKKRLSTVVGISLLFPGADTNLRDQLGATPLHRASGPGHTGVVRLLLAADKTIVDCQVERRDDLVSCRRCLVGYQEISMTVCCTTRTNELRPGSTVCILHTQDKYGNTALHYACEEERNEVARLLISHGANREVLCSIIHTGWFF